MRFKSNLNPTGLACLALVLGACASLTEPSLEPSKTDTAPLDVRTHSNIASVNEHQTTPFPKTLSLCPRMTVSNAPANNSDLGVLNYEPLVWISGTRLAIAPVERACLSSGYGIRSEKLHKGIDLYNRDAAKIFAAANGRVREKHYRADYGNMLVIEHGDGVFSRYAHLESFANDLKVGDEVELGQTIGMMGNTASYRIPRHLHYEVMTGEWGTLTGAFELTTVDIFAHLPQN